MYVYSCYNKESTNLKNSMAAQIIIEKKVPISHTSEWAHQVYYGLLIILIP